MLFALEPGRTDARRIGTIQLVFAPVVRDDGIVLTLARAGGDELVLRPASRNGEVLAEQRLGVSIPGTYSARWDLHRDRILVQREPAHGRGSC